MTSSAINAHNVIVALQVFYTDVLREFTSQNELLANQLAVLSKTHMAVCPMCGCKSNDPTK